MDIKEKFGKKCKELRQKTELSQEKFALKIGIDRTYYSSIEAGKRNVSLENIEKIASGFSIDISSLFRGI